MDTWKIKNKITAGEIHYGIGDCVTVFRRKANGYPRHLNDGVAYYVIRIWGDSVEVSEDRNGTRGYKVHKSFIIQMDTLRDLRLEELFKDE